MLAAFLNDQPINILGAIGSHTADVFGVPKFVVVLCGLCNVFISPFTFIPIQMTFERLGLKKTSMIGQIFILVGAVLRIGIRFSFYLYFLGTFVCSIGGIIFVNTISSYISSWFESK